MNRRIVVVLLGLTLVGCGTRDALEATDPADLELSSPLAVEEIWSRDVGGASGLNERLQPALADGRVYVANAQGELSALDAETGEALWTVSLERPLSGGPAVNDGLVVVGTRKGQVLGLASDDGELLWESGVTSEVLAPAAIGQDTVVVRANDGRVFALEPDTGERRWLYDRNVPALSLRGHSSPVLVRGGVVVGFDNGRITGLTLNDGTPVWETTLGVAQGRSDLERMVDIDADPLAVGGDLFAVSYQGRIAGMSVREGRIGWSRELSAHSGLAVDDSNVYTTDGQGQVWALDRRNGASVWRQDALAPSDLTGPVLHNGRLVVAGSDGYLAWLSPDDGTLLARYAVDDKRLTVTPVVADDRLYALSVGGELVALRFADQ